MQRAHDVNVDKGEMPITLLHARRTAGTEWGSSFFPPTAGGVVCQVSFSHQLGTSSPGLPSACLRVLLSSQPFTRCMPESTNTGVVSLREMSGVVTAGSSCLAKRCFIPLAREEDNAAGLVLTKLDVSLDE